MTKSYLIWIARTHSNKVSCLFAYLKNNNNNMSLYLYKRYSLEKNKVCSISVEYLGRVYKVLFLWDIRHTKNKYRSWCSQLRAEILTIFPSFNNSLVGPTRSTVPPKLSWTSKSFLNFSMRFIASLAWVAAVETKWRAPEKYWE